MGGELEGIFSLVNDLLLVLIIMEVLPSVARFVRRREVDVDVQDIVPFRKNWLKSSPQSFATDLRLSFCAEFRRF